MVPLYIILYVYMPSWCVPICVQFNCKRYIYNNGNNNKNVRKEMKWSEMWFKLTISKTNNALMWVVSMCADKNSIYIFYMCFLSPRTYYILTVRFNSKFPLCLTYFYFVHFTIPIAVVLFWLKIFFVLVVFFPTSSLAVSIWFHSALRPI